MLNLNNVKILVQNCGTILGVFLQGENKEAIEARYNSFWNHQATGGEPEWWCDNTLLFWIHSSGKYNANEKLERAMTFAALAEILNTENTKKTNPMDRARRIARERISQIEMVNWVKTCAVDVDLYEFGDSVSAETSTGNFDDDVLGQGLKRDIESDNVPALKQEMVSVDVRKAIEQEGETVDREQAYVSETIKTS